MEFKKGEIVFKFSGYGVRRLLVEEVNDSYVILFDKKKQQRYTVPINDRELKQFFGRSHDDCIKNTLAEIERLSKIKLY